MDDFDPDAWLSGGGTAVADPPAFDPDAYLNGAPKIADISPFDPDAYLADSKPSVTPETDKVVGDGSVMTATPERGILGSVKDAAMAVREEFSPLIGPTAGEKFREAVEFGKNEDGTPRFEYRPQGSLIDREGLLPAVMSFWEQAGNPMRYLPEDWKHAKSEETDSTAESVGKGLVNTGNDLLGMALNPGNYLLPSKRLVSGAFAIQMASAVPEQIQQFNEAKTVQEKTQALTGLLVNVLFSSTAAGHAAGGRIIPRGKPQEIRDLVAAAPDETLKQAAADPKFRKTWAYSPRLLDAELRAREAKAVETILPATAAVLKESPLPGDVERPNALSETTQTGGEKQNEIANQSEANTDRNAGREADKQVGYQGDGANVAADARQPVQQQATFRQPEQAGEPLTQSRDGQEVKSSDSFAEVGGSNPPPATTSKTNETITDSIAPIRELAKREGETAVAEANLGPGAANAAEFSPGKVTAVKNAKVDEERVARGQPALMAPARQAMGDVWEAAMKKVDADERVGARTVDQILSGEKKEVSDVDQMVLLHEKIDVMNDRDRAAARVNDDSLTDAERAEYRAEFIALEERMTQIDSATQQAGTLSGRALQIRQQMIRDDYSPASMESKARVAKGGKPLTPEEAAGIKAQAEKIADIERNLDDATKFKTEEAAGDAVNEAVKSLKTQASKTAGPESLEGQRESIVAGIKGISEAGGPATSAQSLIQKLALNFVRGGIKERDPLVDAVHVAIKDIFPGMSRAETRDAISGYGDFKPLDKEAAKVQLRQLKGEMQQVGKIEDMQAGQAPKKTGTEKREPSAEERRLIKEVNELKKAGGFTVTDPATQLKTSLGAIKTRLINNIHDLEGAIESKTPIPGKKSGVPYDAEATALKAQRDELRGQYDEIFGKPELTDAQRLEIAKNAAEKSVAVWEERLTNARAGKFEDGSARKLTSPELEAIQAKRDAVKAEYEAVESLDSARQEAQAQAALAKSIADLETRLAENDFSPVPGQKTVDSKAVSELKAKRDELRQSLAAAKAATPEARAAAENRIEQQLRDSIAEYDRRIQEEDLATKTTPSRPTNPEIERLRAERGAMQALFQEMRNAAKPRRTAEEIALAAFKARTSTRIAELHDRISRDDFAPRPRKESGALDAEAKKLAFELDQQKAKFNEGLLKFKLQNRTPAQKIFGSAQEGLNLSRAIITGIDLSGLLRQGGFVAFGNPVRAAKASGAMLRAFRSKKGEFDVLEEIRSRPNFPEYKKAGLYIAENAGASLSKMEEAYMSRWAEKVPVIAGSQRAYSAVLNRLRADTFDAMSKSLSREGRATPEELKVIGNYVNVATGRGDLGKFTQAAVPLNTVFFAPRYVTSRFQLLAGQPFYGGNARTRRAIAGEYAKYLIGVGTVYALAQAATGEKVETDPRSADFGKIRMGDTRIDPMSGLLQSTVLTSRLATGETKKSDGDIVPIRGDDVPFSGTTADDVVKRFLRSKLSPNFSTAGDIIAGQNVVGEKTTPASVASRLVVPISFGDIQKAMEEQGVPKGTALSLLSLFGVGLQTYDSDKDKK